MSIKQHFVALRRVGLQHERSADAKLKVGGQYLAPDTTDDEMFLAPVELEGFAQFEFERYVGFGRSRSAFRPEAAG